MDALSFDNGDELPVLGLGTWKSAPGDVYDAVKFALQTGYRHLDCAAIYGNEAEVGNALSDSIEDGVVARDDVWVTSKLWNDAHRPKHVRPALKETLDDLQLDTLDLYLMHWPIALTRGTGMPESPDDFVSLDEVPLSETWAAMEELVDEGLVRHIGVSNFNVPKLRRLMDTADHTPEMNQVEMHPYLQQRDLLTFADEHDLPLTAYSPLGSKDRPEGMKAADEPLLLEDPTINEIADRHDATPGQVLIRWALQRGTITIPKSVTPSHIEENLAAAELSLTEDDMAAIADLDRGRRYVRGEFWAMEGSPYTMKGIWEK